MVLSMLSSVGRPSRAARQEEQMAYDRAHGHLERVRRRSAAHRRDLPATTQGDRQPVPAGDAAVGRLPADQPARAADLREVYSGAGFYVILTDRAVDGNACRLGSGALRAIYRGECGTVRRRIQSHLFNSLYNSDYDQRSSRYSSDPKNVGRSFYEPHWPHCLKLDPGGPSGINIDQAPHSNFSWLVLVHRMSGSSQRVRQLAELAFDDAFGHPSASRDA